MRKVPIAVALLCLASLSAAQSLSDLERYDREHKPKSGGADPMAAKHVNEGILQLINRDQLKTADELRRAGMLYSSPNLEFDEIRLKYEIILASTALGDKAAENEVAKLWDALQISLGRPQPFGTLSFGTPEPGDKFYPDPAPKSITEVVKDPAKAREIANVTPNNDELKRIVDEDQAARQGDWSKLTQEQLLDIMKKDKGRSNRVHEIIAQGAMHTKQDFASASLVMQHGDNYATFSLAHELSLAAFLLGDKNSAWLLTATYDRMLRSCGQHQRFGTQYYGLGGKYVLAKVDTDGINDTERKAMHCPTLEQARNPKFN